MDTVDDIEESGMKMKMKHWKHPEHYFGKTYYEYYVFLGQSRDSEPLEQSNFNVALDRLGGESETVIVARANHWACGWVEVILVHESDGKHIDMANDMLDELDEYPVLDEDDFMMREDELEDEET